MKTLEMLYGEVLQSEALKREFAQAMQTKDLEGFLCKNECAASVAETEAFLQAQQTKQGALSEEELDSVSGGANGCEAALSALTAGIGCLAVVIFSVSTAGTGKEGREDGEKVLCHDARW